jgi:hypothetical protein
LSPADEQIAAGLSYREGCTFPCRSGLQPDVSFQYNSQTSDSIVGYGWSLPIPYIQRLKTTGSQNLYNDATPYFTSSLDGELALGSTTPTSVTATTTPPARRDSLSAT